VSSFLTAQVLNKSN